MVVYLRDIKKGVLMDTYGGFWLRVVAYIIDGILLAVVGAIVGIIMGVGALGTGASVDPASTGNLLYNLVSIIIGVSYFAGMESSSWQATLGKKAMGLIVTDLDGNQISVPRAIGRYFAKILSALILMIGFIMVAFTERKQGLHDMIAGTLVVKGIPGMSGANPSVFE